MITVYFCKHHFKCFDCKLLKNLHRLRESGQNGISFSQKQLKFPQFLENCDFKFMANTWTDFGCKQAMMKDQFANYVVQKVLETCDDQQRELILSRIKVHLNALKKYTYGKHIVARVEKLVAAGGMHSSFAILICLICN